MPSANGSNPEWVSTRPKHRVTFRFAGMQSSIGVSSTTPRSIRRSEFLGMNFPEFTHPDETVKNQRLLNDLTAGLQRVEYLVVAFEDVLAMQPSDRNQARARSVTAAVQRRSGDL